MLKPMTATRVFAAIFSIAAIAASSNRVQADDLRTTYIWTYAAAGGASPPKLGLQPRNPAHRSLNYERLMITCDRSKKLTITAWPVDLRERAAEPNMDLNFATDLTPHLIPNPQRSFNEMDEVWQVEAVAPNPQPIRDMLGAKSIRLGATGVSMALPKASSSVKAFLAGCDRYSR